MQPLDIERLLLALGAGFGHALRDLRGPSGETLVQAIVKHYSTRSSRKRSSRPFLEFAGSDAFLGNLSEALAMFGTVDDLASVREPPALLCTLFEASEAALATCFKSAKFPMAVRLVVGKFVFGPWYRRNDVTDDHNIAQPVQVDDAVIEEIEHVEL